MVIVLVASVARAKPGVLQAPEQLIVGRFDMPLVKAIVLEEQRSIESEGGRKPVQLRGQAPVG
ncbi:hypothetical protein [Hydrogenophaga sp.]|uniref:hypothetical protein n=1 Tax=Hydrogenophaga sp. TaxID=1904254 RepID=UPI003F709173